MRRGLLVAGALALGLGASVVLADEGGKAGADKVGKGQQVYAAQHCSMCHSIAGKGNPKTPLDDVGSRMKGEDLKKYIVSPKSVKTDSKMKAYTSLPADDLDSLVAYLLTLTKKGA